MTDEIGFGKWHAPFGAKFSQAYVSRIHVKNLNVNH